MKQKYILLYKKNSLKNNALRKNTITKEVFRGPEHGFRPPGQANSQVKELDSTEATKLEQDPDNDVQYAIPAMPLRLIAPLAADHQPLQQSKTSWGIEATNAHNTQGLDGKGIKVAVLDTGINAHPAFDGITITPKDFTNEGIQDTSGHGTHCAAIIAGRDVMGMRIGIARGITELLVGKVIGENGATTEILVDAIRWAMNEGANIISLSLGIDFPGHVRVLNEEEKLPLELATSVALDQYRKNLILFDILAEEVKANNKFNRNRQVILIGAAGNESKRNERPDFELGVCPPAVIDGFISVGALGKKDDKFFVPFFSNTGAMLCGPGVDIISAGPNDGLAAFSGTSMAVPHVAGVAALWAQQLKNERRFTADALTSALIHNCRMAGLENENSGAYGQGMVQAP